MKKLYEIYNLVPSKDSRTALSKHWNQAIQKTVDELDEKDICMFLRQNDFLDILIPLTIQKIYENPLYGDMFDGEALANLSEVKALTSQNIEEIKKLIPYCRKFASDHKWEDTIDKEEYLKEIQRAEENLALHQ